MQSFYLAIPSVQVQQWGNTYDFATALAEGTVFPELNLPFFAAPEGSNSTLPQTDDPDILFGQICFVLDDILLYLDTHPDDQQAIAFYEQCLHHKKELLQKTRCGCACSSHYKWEQKPLVWEGGHC